MANKTIPTYIDMIRDRLLAQADLVAAGFTKRTVYKQFLDGLKTTNIVYPCLTISTDRDGREVWAAIDELKLYITVHMDEYSDAETVVNAVIDSLHLFNGTSTDRTVTVYYTWYKGGPPTPMWNAKRGKWEAIMRFDSSIGGC